MDSVCYIKQDIMGRDVIIVRLGEITVKGKSTRNKFEKILISNMKDALKSEGYQFEIRREWGRIYVYAPRDSIDVLKRVFGIKSLSPAYEVEFNGLEDLLKKAEEFFADKISNKVFAVEARRSGVHEFTSIDVEKKLGERLLKYGKGVDLENPKVTAYVEVREKRAYFFTDIIYAYGGLPIGSEGKVVSLFSGGFDSAVASWYLLRRGAKVHYVFCNLGGEAYKRAVLAVLKVLGDKWSYGYNPKLYVIPFSQILKKLREKTKRSYLNVLLKRCMYRAGEIIAQKVGAEAIVTGESLGQVSSQTLRNLYVSSLAIKMQIFRPLIGFDKDDIVKVAREIGTYEYSSLVKEYCGAFTIRPATHTNPKEIEEEEKKVGVDILYEAISNAEIIDVRKISLEEDINTVDIETIPPGALVVDLRPREKYMKWHLEGSIHMDFDEVFEKLARLDKNKTYVFLCDEGALSREAAFFLRRLGYKAYSLKGGIKKLRRK